MTPSAGFRAKTFLKGILWHLLRDDDGLRDVRTLSGPCRGTRLRIDIRSESAYWLGSYDRGIVNRIRRWVDPGAVAWDCGSFLGYYGAALRRAVGDSGEVHLFEASSINFHRAQQLPLRNRWSNVHVHHMAIGLDHAVVRFDSARAAASGPVDVPGKTAQADAVLEEVSSSGLDELIDERGFRPPAFIKFDLEGAECFALRNGARMFREIRPTLLIELHRTGSDRIPPAFEAVIEFLRECRYRAMEVHRNVMVSTMDELLAVEATGTQCMLLTTPAPQ